MGSPLLLGSFCAAASLASRVPSPWELPLRHEDTHVLCFVCPPHPVSLFYGLSSSSQKLFEVFFFPFAEGFAARVLRTSVPLLVGMGLTQHISSPS